MYKVLVHNINSWQYGDPTIIDNFNSNVKCVNVIYNKRVLLLSRSHEIHIKLTSLLLRISGPISGMGVVLSACCVIICSLMQLLHGHTLKITLHCCLWTHVYFVYMSEIRGYKDHTCGFWPMSQHMFTSAVSIIVCQIYVILYIDFRLSMLKSMDLSPSVSYEMYVSLVICS